jgi:hypothetical protein
VNTGTNLRTPCKAECDRVPRVSCGNLYSPDRVLEIVIRFPVAALSRPGLEAANLDIQSLLGIKLPDREPRRSDTSSAAEVKNAQDFCFF